MTSLQQTIIELSEKIDSVSAREIERVFNKYSKIPPELQNIVKLRKRLKIKHPILFNRNVQFANNFISSNKQEEIKLRTLKIHSGHISKLSSLKAIENYLEGCLNDAEAIKRELENLFPKEKFNLSFRVKEPESILQNIKWGNSYTLVDVIGLRIVPKQSYFSPLIVKKIEEFLRTKLAFKINIFSYSTNEIVKKISKNSIYYRAIHYHLKTGRFFTEIQVRTPAVDQWANLSHDLLYKTKFEASEETKNCIMEFGRVANIVDYFDILKNR